MIQTDLNKLRVTRKLTQTRGQCRGGGTDKLTLLVELPDDGVQVGVLESHVTSSHRHRGRVEAALLRSVEFKEQRQEEVQEVQRGVKVLTSVRAEEQQQVCEEEQEELLLLLLRLGQTRRIRSELPPPPSGCLPAPSTGLHAELRQSSQAERSTGRKQLLISK